MLPSRDHYSARAHTLQPSGGLISGAIVAVTVLAGRADSNQKR